MATIEIFKGRTRTFTYSLQRKRTIIGRNQDADIPLDDPTVSRRHAVIKKQGNAFIIEEQGTQSGMFVNGTYMRFRVLKDGDHIEIARHLLIFRKTKEEVETAPINAGENAYRVSSTDMTEMMHGKSAEKKVAQIRKQVNSSARTEFMAPDVQQQLREVLAKRRQPHLTWLENGKRKIISIEGENVLLGWDESCEIIFPGKKWFFKVPARIRKKEEGFEIDSLSLFRRIYVNNERISTVVLKDQDQIKIGGFLLRFHSDLKSAKQRS